ncbi:MAG: SDR family NAD(P)-dependent oxidoreductase [Pseudomonadales bacterium]
MAFEGKVVLITGGGSGMGQLAARIMSEQGKSVAIFDVNAEGMAKTAEGYENIHAWAVDMSDAAAVKAAVVEVEAQLGPVDRLYNAAAIMPFGALLDMDAKATMRMMDINYGGLVNITHAVLPGMVERRRGDFISFASVAGLIPTMLTGAYSASKAATAFYTEILYHENIQSGVRFACVCPPPVATPLLQQGRDTVWPKMLDQSKTIEPKEVLQAIERDLDKGVFWVFPNSQARLGSRMRRFLPGLVWKQCHTVEGR